MARRGASLIVLDLVLPDMDGYQVLDELNQRHELKCIPVIVVSAAAADDLSVERLERQGAVVFRKAELTSKEFLEAVDDQVTRAERECVELASIDERV